LVIFIIILLLCGLQFDKQGEKHQLNNFHSYITHCS